MPFIFLIPEEKEHLVLMICSAQSANAAQSTFILSMNSADMESTDFGFSEGLKTLLDCPEVP